MTIKHHDITNRLKIWIRDITLTFKLLHDIIRTHLPDSMTSHWLI